MFDDFRQSSDEASFEEKADEADDMGIAISEPQQNFLGMTGPQRLVIAIMLLMMTCVLGAFCLLVTERIFPPFLG